MGMKEKNLIVILPISILIITIIIIIIGTIIGNISLANTNKTSTIEEHRYLDATCTEPKTCIQCKATVGEALGHTGGTHDNGGVCTRCNTKYQDHKIATNPYKYDMTADTHVPIYNCSFQGCNFTSKGIEEKHNYINAKCEKCGYIMSINSVSSVSSISNIDNTQSNTKLPQTGTENVIVVISMVILMITIIVAIRKIIEYRDIQ